MRERVTRLSKIKPAAGALASHQPRESGEPGARSLFFSFIFWGGLH